MGRKPWSDSTSHTVLAVAMRARGGRLEVLLAGAAAERACRARVARRRARPRDRRRRARARRAARDAGAPRRTARDRVSRARPGRMPSSTATGARGPATPPDERELVAAAQARLRAKLSYTNVGFALAPETFTISELREIYVAALGHDVSATNLQRVLLRRGALERVDGQRAPGPRGRPPGGALPLRLAAARGDGRVRSPPAATLARPRPATTRRQARNRTESVTCLPQTGIAPEIRGHRQDPSRLGRATTRGQTEVTKV